MSGTLPDDSRVRESGRASELGEAALPCLRQGNQWLDKGDALQAERSFVAGLREAPEHLELLHGLALALQRQRRYGDAITLLRRAAVLHPNAALIQNSLGSVLGETGDMAGALEALRRACELDANFAAARANLGKALYELGRVAEAEAPLRQALTLSPQLESSRFLLAESLMMLGHIDESTAQYRELLRRYPLSGLAWWGLANLKSIRMGVADVQTLTLLVQRRDLALDEHIAARFALAKALDDIERPLDAFAAYRDANLVAQQRFRWNASGFAQWIGRVREAFDRTLPIPSDAALGREVIFIVGMPRSASTLTEQILAAHPEVEGASELDDLGAVIAEESSRTGRAFPDWVSDASGADWQRLGRRYLDRTAHWRARRPYFTDKTPGNWMLVAAIRQMLPAARIIDCRRDPLETCWSCFRQIFWHAHEYSYSFDDLAAYWRIHDSAIRHWRGQYPAWIREQVYEQLLAGPEEQTRALLDFCGLPFDAVCLRFHEAERSVRTASAAQVREPLRHDTARASRYGDLLDPLRRALA